MKKVIKSQEKNTHLVALELSKILADENILYIKTKNAHWNVVGADFYAVHKFFEVQINEIDIFIDSVAERIRSVGHFAPATLKAYLELTHLTEKSRSKNDSKGFIKELISDHESIVFKLKENINLFEDEYKDAGTADFICSLMQDHEKMTWFLKSHLSTI